MHPDIVNIAMLFLHGTGVMMGLGNILRELKESFFRANQDGYDSMRDHAIMVAASRIRGQTECRVIALLDETLQAAESDLQDIEGDPQDGYVHYGVLKAAVLYATPTMPFREWMAKQCGVDSRDLGII